MEYAAEGELYTKINHDGRINEKTCKELFSQIVAAVDHMHSHNIIHRDNKPENLVLDARGYVRVTDLGIARLWKLENGTDTSGTPGYMAPEVMCRQNHTFAVDYYALGVLAYEFMLGRRPYYGRSRKEIRD